MGAGGCFFGVAGRPYGHATISSVQYHCGYSDDRDILDHVDSFYYLAAHSPSTDTECLDVSTSFQWK
jgi:hypothetical protein